MAASGAFRVCLAALVLTVNCLGEPNQRSTCSEPLQAADSCCIGEPRLFPKKIFDECRELNNADPSNGMRNNNGMNRVEPMNNGRGNGDGPMRGGGGSMNRGPAMRGDGPIRGGGGSSMGSDGSMRGGVGGPMSGNGPMRGGSDGRGPTRNRRDSMDNMNRGSGRPGDADAGNERGENKATVLKVPFKAMFKNSGHRRKPANSDSDDPNGGPGNDGPLGPSVMSSGPGMGKINRKMPINNDDTPSLPIDSAPMGKLRPMGDPCIMDCAFKNMSYFTEDRQINVKEITTGFVEELMAANAQGWKTVITSAVKECAAELNIDSKANVGQACPWNAKIFMTCMRKKIVGNCPFIDPTDSSCSGKLQAVNDCDPFIVPKAKPKMYAGRRTMQGAVGDSPANEYQEQPDDQDNDGDYPTPPPGKVMGKRLNIYTNLKAHKELVRQTGSAKDAPVARPPARVSSRNSEENED